MDTIKRGFSAVKRSYDWVIAQIGIHPGVTFWLIVAYLIVRR